jgi:hypothetical protein
MKTTLLRKGININSKAMPNSKTAFLQLIGLLIFAIINNCGTFARVWAIFTRRVTFL